MKRSLTLIIVISWFSTVYGKNSVSVLEKKMLREGPHACYSRQEYIATVRQKFPHHPLPVFWEFLCALFREQYAEALSILPRVREPLPYLARRHPFYDRLLEELPFVEGTLYMMAGKPRIARRYFRAYLQFLRHNQFTSRRIPIWIARLFVPDIYLSASSSSHEILIPNIQDIVEHFLEYTFMMEALPENPRIPAEPLSHLNRSLSEYFFLPESPEHLSQSAGYITAQRFHPRRSSLREGILYLPSPDTFLEVRVTGIFSQHQAISFLDFSRQTGWIYAGVSQGNIYPVKIVDSLTLVVEASSTWSFLNTDFRERSAIPFAHDSCVLFVSNRPGGMGGLDLWIACITPSGEWKIWNPGPTINTPFHEMSPWVWADTLLIFASDGYPSLGYSDLYLARLFRTPDSVGISEPAWLPPDINSPAIEIFPLLQWLEGDTFLLIWSSNRMGGKGGLDLYSARISPSSLLQRSGVPVITLMQSIQTEMELSLSSNESSSPLNDGESLLPEPPKVSFAPLWRIQDSLSHELLKPSPQYGDSLILLGRIYFPFRETKVEEIYQKELETLARMILLRRFRKILLVGHTDSIGSRQFNYHLGLDRARNVQQILRAEGVPIHWIDVRSLGETMPLAPNTTEEGRRKNRRVDILVRPRDILFGN